MQGHLSQLGLVVVVGFFVGACSSDDDTASSGGDSGGVSVSSALTSDSSQSANTQQNATLESVAVTLADQDVDGFVDGDDPTGDGTSSGSCFTVEKKALPPTLVLTAKGADGCAVTAGEITVTREGAIANKYVLVALGSGDKPLVVRGVEVQGYLKVNRDSGETSFSTCNSIGEESSTDCSSGDEHCVRVCQQNKDGACDNAEQSRLGLLGTATTETAASITVTINASGSMWSSDLGDSVQSINLGTSAKDLCSDEGFDSSSALVYVFAQSLEAPSCLCPTSGTGSTTGAMDLTAGIDCSTDEDKDPNFEVTVHFDQIAVEMVFNENCAPDPIVSCSASTTKVMYENVNFKSCGLSACTTSIKTALGCNTDCTSCTTPDGGVSVEQLKNTGVQSTFMTSLTSAIESVASDAGTTYGGAVGSLCQGQ